MAGLGTPLYPPLHPGRVHARSPFQPQAAEGRQRGCRVRGERQRAWALLFYPLDGCYRIVDSVPTLPCMEIVGQVPILGTEFSSRNQ